MWSAQALLKSQSFPWLGCNGEEFSSKKILFSRTFKTLILPLEFWLCHNLVCELWIIPGKRKKKKRVDRVALSKKCNFIRNFI